MDKVLFLASTAGKEIMRAQAVNSNNLANASTVGFRKDFAYAQSLAVKGDVYDSRVYSHTKGMGSDYAPGAVMTTGHELDVAIQGDGWIAVQGLDGQEAYTRRGDFRVTAGGLLTTGSGHPVIGANGGPVTVPPNEKLDIGSDGTISIRGRGQAANTLVEVDRLKLVNPPVEELVKAEDGLFKMAPGEVAPPDAAVRVISGALEGSNVNGVESMIQMMELARKWELNVKVMEKANELDGASAQLMRMS